MIQVGGFLVYVFLVNGFPCCYLSQIVNVGTGADCLLSMDGISRKILGMCEKKGGIFFACCSCRGLITKHTQERETTLSRICLNLYTNCNICIYVRSSSTKESLNFELTEQILRKNSSFNKDSELQHPDFLDKLLFIAPQISNELAHNFNII